MLIQSIAQPKNLEGKMGKGFLPKIFIPVATKTVWDCYRGQVLGLIRGKKSGMDTRSSSAWRVCPETTVLEKKWECTPECEAQADPQGVCRGKERAFSWKGVWIFTKRDEVVKEQVGFLLVWACSTSCPPGVLLPVSGCHWNCHGVGRLDTY